ncbi:MAG: response regulator [Bacteroidales bacterium]|nr:response regulator [Bacteroidales bacterium]
MKHARLLTSFLAIIITLSATAQTARIYTSADGLANSHIHDIFQDSKGFIWLSTENGLSRFDGIRFYNATVDISRPSSIASNIVRTVFEDSMGKFWVGTSAGLQTFDTEYSRFTKVNLEDWSVPDSDQHIVSIIEIFHNGERKIIASSSGHGLYIINAENHQIDRETQNFINKLLPSKFISRVFKDSAQRLWIATEDGGVKVIDLNKTAEISDIWGKDLIKESSDIINTLVEDEATGNIFLGSTNNGIMIWEAATGKIRRTKKDTGKGISIMSMIPNNLITRYGDNTYLVGLENHGLKLFDTQKESLSDIRISNLPFNTDGWKIHDLMEDNQGNVWIGAAQTGAVIIPKSMFGFRTIDLNTKDTGNTHNTSVTSIVSDENRDCLWVGTDGNGIFRTDNEGNTINLSAENSRISNNSIMSLALDKRGTLWVATYLGGLFSYTTERGFRQFRDQASLGSDKIYNLVYSTENDLLYVGTHGNGFSMVDVKEEKVLRTWNDDENKWISYLTLDNSGLLWIGTYDGPKTYDSRNDRLTKHELIKDKSIRVNSVFESKDGNIWIGTGEGLIRMDRATKEKRFFTEEDGLACNSVSSILEDNNGYLWISTLNGLSRLHLETGTFKNFRQYDGLQENEFNTRAAYKADNGRMYFGGISGITAFNPQYVDRRERSIPPLFLSSLNVMNEVVRYDPMKGDNNILDKHISEATQITLPNNADLFSLGFSVLEYTNPQRVAYQYMMEGLEKSWNSTLPDSHNATYTNLASGKYKLKIKAFYDGEPDEFSYREIDIRVLPPWYMSFWAWLIYIVTGILAIMGLLDLRNRRIALKAHQEESEIKEMKLQMFTNISHEIRTPLTLVMNPLKKMRESEQDMKQKDMYNLMYRNCLRILRMVNQLMDMRKVDNGQMKLHFVETDVVYFIKDIMQSFQNLAVSRNIHFHIENVQNTVNLWIDQGNFDKIIFNILSNAFKHTPDSGEIRISINEPAVNTGILNDSVKEYVEFVIENSGEPIEDKHLNKLFERFYQADVRDARMGSGVGLHLTKMLVDLHHGNISAHNTDTGVAFKLRIPVGCMHLTAEEMTRPENHKDLYTKSTITQEEHTSTEDITYNAEEDNDENIRNAKSRKRIVLVDDDSEMRAYLKLELQSIYNVDVYANGKDAWAKISTSIPDAVITDLVMEKMDGAELCEKIKKNPGTNHIPVILLTSSTDEQSQHRCIESGADRYFTKPISLEILKSALAGAIATRETMRNKFGREIDYGYNELKITDSDNQLATKVISIIRQNIENSDFSVEELSREVGMSRVHLNRKLKETMNISPSNLIKSIRLKQAAYLLINNKVNISEVAYKVGFSTHSYFSNSFHDYFGMTPKEFTTQYANCTDEDVLKKLFG